MKEMRMQSFFGWEMFVFMVLGVFVALEYVPRPL
jgi:hypothetical protein